MAAISGASTVIAVQIATTWGTSVAVGASDKLPAELTYASNLTELVAREIGTGNQMIGSATRGSIKPTVNLTMDMGYNNNADVLLAQFMGTSGAPAEQTGGQSDYKHTLTYNSTLNAKYVTLAAADTSSTSLEFPTCAVRSVTLKPQSIPGYVDVSYELLANDIETGSATNTYAVVAAATARSNNELVATGFNDSVWINATSGGSLSSSDKLNITDWSLTLTRPQELPNEITGSSGNGAPYSTGLFEGSLSLTLKELPDHTWFTAWDNETKYKIKIAMDGAQIGSGVNYSLAIYIPQMQLIQEPGYSVTSPGMNPVTLNFKISKATANPTGMSSTYPYFEIINTFSTSLLA